MKGIKMPVISLCELDRTFLIKENGRTFLENALKKTRPVSQAYKDELVAGEDSGLEVDYLKGKPGIYSKRYSGKNSTYKKNNIKLLTELQGVRKKDRKACFYCCLVLLRNGKLVKNFEGRLRGSISEKPAGENGFGYDPVFYLPACKKTVAQLSVREKNKISHRARAFFKLKTYLLNHRQK